MYEEGYIDEEGYVDEDEEDLPAAERDLSDDAQWKIIQKNTFTRWANEHLKTKNMTVADLQYDFADGLKLIALVESLSGQKFKHVNKRPTFRTQKLENVTMTMTFLEEYEGLRVVNIDSTDIVDCKLKLILGLIWTLILHYSITMPLWEGEEELPADEKGKPSPKARLLAWINSKMPDKPVKNFTTDWNDGTSIGALVDAVAPGLCPDWPEWQPKQALRNAKEAMDAAEQWLDVPQLVKPEEMVNPRVDEKAMMTYLSQFPNAKLNPGAPVRPRTNPARVRAYGPGLEPQGNTVGAPARFTIDTFSAGRGAVDVIVLNPKGQKEPCEVIANNDKNLTYSCAYVPTMEGEYRVIVKFAGKEVPQSPFKVMVEGAAGDPGRVTAAGPGIEPTGNMVGRRTFFNIFTTGAGAGNVDCVILDPQGRRDAVKPRITRQAEDNFLVEYTPKEEGLHSVNVFFAGQQIPNSPYGVMVAAREGGPLAQQPMQPQMGQKRPMNQAPMTMNNAPVAQQPQMQNFGPGSQKPGLNKPSWGQPQKGNMIGPDPEPVDEDMLSPKSRRGPQKAPPRGGCNPKQAYATGRGIQPHGVRVRDRAEFQVHTEDAGEGECQPKVTGPGGEPIPCQVRRSGPHLYDCSYVPQRPGPHLIPILYGGDHIQRSPFNVEVGPFKDSRIRAFGPGLSGGVVNKPALFVVETNGETGALGFSIEGPSEAKIDCIDNGDGSANVAYWPTVPGEYAVHVLCDDEDIPKSPYMAQITPDVGACDPNRVTAYGPGIEPTGNVVNVPTEFTVDIRNAGGPAPLKVEAFDNEGEPVPLQVRDKGDGTFQCTYTPRKPKKHTIIVSYGTVNTPKSPYRVEVSEGLSPTSVKVYGPGIESATLRQPTYFVVDCREAGPGDIGISVANERGQDVPVETKDNGDGTFSIHYTPMTPGPTYTVQVYFADREVPRSPYKVPIRADFDPNKLHVEGLEPTATVGVPKEFDVITAGSGTKAKPNVTVKRPNGLRAPVNVEPTVDGYAVSFTPTEPGHHQVSVDVNGHPVDDSPFDIDADVSVDENAYPKKRGPSQHGPPVDEGLIDPRKAPNRQQMPDSKWPPCRPGSDASRVRAYGDGLSRATAKKPARFTIDSREAPPAPLGVTVEGPAEAKIDCVDNGDGTCGVEYLPPEPGLYTVNVLYNDEHIPNSPYTSQVVPAGKENLDVSRVRAYGPGLQPNGVFKESFAKFTVDATPIDKWGEGNVRAIVTNPRGQKTACLVDNNKDGTYKCSYSPVDQGPHKIDVTYDGLAVPGSPFPVNVVPGCDPTRVRAYGPGLEGGVSGQPATFKVDLDGAGQGGLGLAIEGPADAQIQCQDNKDGTCTVNYFPTKGGTYDVFVKFNDVDIPGSPFQVPIRSEFDPTKVKCYGPGIEPNGARAGKPATFTVDASNAGEAPLQVTTTDRSGRPRPAQVRPRGPGQPGIYDVTYFPESEGPCQIDVKYGQQSVPRFPMTQHVLPSADPGRVIVTGEGVKPRMGSIPATLPTSFNVDTRPAGQGDLELALVDPEGRSLPLDVDTHGDGTFTCHYKPNDVGKHTVKVKFGGREINESPFVVNVGPSGRADLCRIEGGNREQVPVNEECVITVNTSQAGRGSLTCRIITPTGTPANVDVEDNNDGTVSIYYTPKTRGDYAIEIKFGGVVIPGGQFRQKAVAPNEMNGYMMETHSVTTTVGGGFKPVDFRFQVGPVFNSVDAMVHMPSGRTARPHLINNQDGTVTIQYQPIEYGLHELVVTYNGQPIPGSPFKFNVDAPVGAGLGKVSAYGPGLTHGRTGETAEFTIVTRDAGAGGLALAVEGPSKAEIQCRDNKDGTCTVHYLPLAPGDYNIIIKFMDRHIPGSPFTAKISGEPRKRAQVCVGTTSEVPLKISETDIHNLSATVKSPSFREEPCILKRMPDGHLGISFTPREIGEHLVNVYRHGVHIKNSPFKIFVGDNEIGNPSRVRVYGEGIEHGIANELNQFTVDTRNAGYGGLSLSIEGPSKAEIECHDNHDGTCLVTFRPTEPGTYIVNIKYADQHVPGSPFAVKIGGEPSARLMERITRHRDAPDVTTVGSQCELSLKIPGTNPMDMTAIVTSPSGMTERCEITDLDDCHYSIKFIPREMGVHTVSVKHRDMHIPGSPFQFTVGPITEGGAHKVHAGGPGLQYGHLHSANEFNIYTREAGAGGLSIAIEGPSKAEIDFEDRRDGSCGVTYRVSEPGEYFGSIKFNDVDIPGSPFRILVGETGAGYNGYGIQEATHFTSIQDQSMSIGHPAAFTINFSGSQAHLRAYVQAPSGREEEATLQSLGRDQYAVRFVPSEQGTHLIHVTVEGRPLPGSPFRVMVGEQVANPMMVRASGEGLTRGRVAEKNRFFVSTQNAGSGALSVTVDGPSKVQLNCHEKDDGYEFTYQATAPGEYLVNIMYGGPNHIPGSPFKAIVTGTGSGFHAENIEQQSHVFVESSQHQYGPSRPEKVSAHGVGLKKAYIGQLNEFNVDATEAGVDMLFVGIAGPVRPCEEVNIKHVGRNQFNVTYKVKERGRHMLMVKWGDQHIPGSPFVVDVP